MAAINAWAAPEARKRLEPFSYDPGPLHPDEVADCGGLLRHLPLDLSVLNNEWGTRRVGGTR